MAKRIRMKNVRIMAFVMLFGLSLPAQSQTKETNDTTSLQFHTGSADTLTATRMNKGLVTNALQAMSGQTAGVNVNRVEPTEWQC
jgi:hypothetical protein